MYPSQLRGEFPSEVPLHDVKGLMYREGNNKISHINKVTHYLKDNNNMFLYSLIQSVSMFTFFLFFFSCTEKLLESLHHIEVEHRLIELLNMMEKLQGHLSYMVAEQSWTRPVWPCCFSIQIQHGVIGLCLCVCGVCVLKWRNRKQAVPDLVISLRLALQQRVWEARQTSQGTSVAFFSLFSRASISTPSCRVCRCSHCLAHNSLPLFGLILAIMCKITDDRFSAIACGAALIYSQAVDWMYFFYDLWYSITDKYASVLHLELNVIKPSEAPPAHITGLCLFCFVLLYLHDFHELTCNKRVRCTVCLLYKNRNTPKIEWSCVKEQQSDINSHFITEDVCNYAHRGRVSECVRACWDYKFHSGLCMISPYLMNYVSQSGSKALVWPLLPEQSSETRSRVSKYLNHVCKTLNTTKLCQGGLIMVNVST